MAIILVQFVPTTVISLLALWGFKVGDRIRRAWIWLVLACLVCNWIDAGLLAALPKLGLSFGPVGLPLFCVSLLRLGLLTPAVAYLLLRKSPNRRVPALVILTIALQVGLLGGEAYGLVIEPFRLGVTQLPILSPAFFPDRPLRILQISDIHVERITRRERDLLAQVQALHPDMIVLTGDFVNVDYLNDPLALAETHALLAQLHAPYGVYAATSPVDEPKVKAAIFTGLNIRLMDDRVETLSFPGGSLALVGVTNTEDWNRDRRMLGSLMAGIPPDTYTLLLYHTPDLIETAAAEGVDLELAGHTHGGQIRLPFYGAVITFSRYGKKYEMGKYIVRSTTLYVSRGVGMEGFGAPRVRFLCPPEIVLVELGKGAAGD
jgi:predicted MPP superfamily phosphohydrolase